MTVDIEDRLLRAAPALDAAIEAQISRSSSVGDGHRSRTSRRPLLAAAVVAALAGGAIAVAATRSSDDVTTVPSAAPAAEAPATTTVVDWPTTLDEPLGAGSVGDEVSALQQRLTELGFWPGPIDGEFGAATQQAVWAFEKLVLAVPRAEATGVVTDEMWQQMQAAGLIPPRRSYADGTTTTRNHTEIYLPEQVVAFFVDDEPALVSHISSGSGDSYQEVLTVDPGEPLNQHGDEPIEVTIARQATTPGGVFEYERFVTGRRQTALGGMENPAYFNYGIAIHGAANVPLEPVSHGGVRVSLLVGERFHAFVAAGDQVFVFDGEAEPEEYGAQLPVFDRLDATTPSDD